jgi:hypothetical protein
MLLLIDEDKYSKMILSGKFGYLQASLITESNTGNGRIRLGGESGFVGKHLRAI